VLNVPSKELEKHELVAKMIYPVIPPKVKYALTDFGLSLIPIISAIGQWGNQHEERLRTFIDKNLEP
jgi:DNA-binding HxlR family transcriptional regulator